MLKFADDIILWADKKIRNTLNGTGILLREKLGLKINKHKPRVMKSSTNVATSRVDMRT